MSVLTQEQKVFSTLKGIAFGVLFVVLDFMACPHAHAVETILQYELPTQNCDGTAIAPTEIASIEFYLADASIPASDVPCAGPGSPPDTPPATATRVESVPTLGTGQVTVDLLGGITYFIRARVSNVAGEWSNLSAEVSRAVPNALLRPPTVVVINF